MQIRERLNQRCQPPGPQEGVGQEGIRPQDAGMGQARRQAQGKRQSKTEGEVNRGYLQARGGLLVQIHVAGLHGAGVLEAGQRQSSAADGGGTQDISGEG